MKKMNKKILLLVTLVFLFIGGKTVSAYEVLKSFQYDFNTYTGITSNYKNHTYIDIPRWSVYKSTSVYKIGSGWNYTRWKKINWYTGDY